MPRYEAVLEGGKRLAILCSVCDDVAVGFVRDGDGDTATFRCAAHLVATKGADDD